MREKLSRLARGVIERKVPEIEITPEMPCETISYGMVHKAEIVLKSTNRKLFRGLIYSSNPRVKLMQPYFAGTIVYIGYNVDSTRLITGDVIEGCFEIVTNGGEFSVPYKFSVKAETEIKEQAASEPEYNQKSNIPDFLEKANEEIQNSASDECEITREIVKRAQEKFKSFAAEGDAEFSESSYGNAENAGQLLSDICETLIKEKRVDAEAFSWYKRAVSQDINVPGLYDYFLEALPENYNEIMPREICMFFSFNPPKNAYSQKKLYKNILNHFSTTSPTYISLEGQMRQFVISEILEKHIDEDLAQIYMQFLSVDMVDSRMASILPDMLLTYKMEMPYGFNRVHVNYDELNGEQIMETRGESAVFPLYTRQFTIYVSDGYGHKKLVEDPHLTRLLPGTNNILEACVKIVPTLPAYRISLAHKLMSLDSISKEQFDFLYDMAGSSGISEAFSAKIKSSLINLYDWSKEKSDKELLLELGKEKLLSNKDREKLCERMIEVGFISEAESDIRKIGFENIDAGKLVDVCKNSINSKEQTSDEFTKFLAYYIYENDAYDGEIISYLAKNYNGLSKNMYRILKDTIAENMPVYDLPERLLCQLLFIDNKNYLDEIFRIYAENCSVDRLVLKAYYAVKSHYYFMEEDIVDAELFDSVKMTLASEILTGDIPVIIQLAISKFCSEKDILSDEDKSLLQKIISGLCQKGIIFPYFKKFADVLSLSDEIKDKTMVSYRANDGESVALILTPEDDEEDSVYMEMTHVYEGLFVKSILLYEGECEHYEIRVTDENGNSSIVKEGELSADITSPDEERRFVRLNKLIRGSVAPSDEAWQAAMDRYALDDTINDLIFK